MIKISTGYQGQLSFDENKPEGTPVKRLDVTKMQALGWQADYKLKDGLQEVWNWYCKHRSEA